MKLLASLCLFLCIAFPVAAESGPLVEIGSVAPGVVVDFPYATENNFVGRAVYECGRCFLRRGTAEKVAKAQRYLAEKGLGLKMWDCYRPLSVQKIFWSLVPDARFVADPRKGSSHNRGTAVDVTLVDSNGKELEMPTGFDDFSPRASHSETSLSAAALKNRALLAEAMRRAGFQPLSTEWWHYDDPQGERELLDVSFREICR